MEEDNLQLPQITEQFANVEGPSEFSAVDFVYNDILSKSRAPSLLEQIDTVKDDANYFSSLFNSTQDNRISFNEDRININEAYSRLSDGSYITRYDEGFIKGADNEEIYAQRQGSGSKWINGLGKFVGKTVVNVVGGVLGTAYGALNAVVDGNWERVYDNDFYDFLDDQNTKMDNFAANYRTQQERDLGFFGSMGTANFWADDFLGGLSFLTGTVISESLWAVATGGASLSTTAARVGLRGAKYFNTAKSLLRGVKEAQKTARKYNRLSSIRRSADTATRFGKAGELVNLARFTYTGAGFEAGMEARLYEKEQKENFNRDFESLNGRPPTAQEIADFESNLSDTTNALWATNMALVGTSNFAILGKTFGVKSPFSLPTKKLNRILFGNGVKTTFGEAGERIATEAIKRNKFQRGLGFATNVLKNPFYEGFVEEGGQATASTAMESYLTSRYNPSKEAMDIAGSFYEGLSHTYGTKQGWKEVGLGMLIGLVGGEGTNVLSGRGAFRDARNALTEQDQASVNRAEILNKNRGTDIVDKIYATRFEQNLNHATEIQDAQREYDEAFDQGSVMGMANAQGKVMLSSVKYAVDLDYLEEQIADFEVALRMQDPAEVAQNFGIEESQVESKIEELVGEYRQIGEEYNSAKEFANYIVSDNPKELFEDGTDVDVLAARTAIAYQMVMTNIMERNMEGAHEALLNSVSQLNPQVASEYMKALRKFNAINRSKKEDVQALAKAENRLALKQKQLEALNKQLLKVDQTRSNTPEGNQSAANRYNKLANKIGELTEEVAALTQDVAEKNGRLNSTKDELSQLNASTRALANQLDSIDPLAPANDLISEITLEETIQKLEELDNTLSQVARTNPVLVEQITKLAQEYKDGLQMWKRNADTIADLADPKLGLKRVGTLVQKKKVAGEDTLTFLKRLQKTQTEELEFSTRLDGLVNNNSVNENAEEVVSEEVNEQERAEADPGEDITQSPQQETTVESRIEELRQALRDLVGKNRFVLENFSNDGAILEQQEAPTQEEVDEYTSLRNKFRSGDINRLLGRDISEIGRRTKERSGLTDQEIQRLQDLSQKMLNWRIVTGTNSNGVSIQDILNQIEAYQQEVQSTSTQVTAEQVLEMAEEGQSEFSVDKADPDYVNSMDKVNIARDKIQTTISHLALETLEDNGFSLTYLREENRGTEDRPQMARVYEVEKDENTFEIQYTNDHHRIIISNKNTKAFLDGMGMQTVKYNTKTGWGYAFKDGVPMESDFGINLINNPEVNILNPQLIYELQPGDKLSFVVNMQDMYNNNEILPLIESGNIDLAEKLMSIYVVNQNKEVLGFLKAGRKEEGSNFNKVREEAFIALQDRLNNNELTLEDLANDNTNSVINLPFEVEVEKTFVGTPNIELESDGSPKAYKITAEQSDMIVDFGYAENGKLNGKLTREDGVRMTFIPKKKSTPYVVIQHGNTKVAFPVGLTESGANLQQGVLDILNSNLREQDKITEIINFLRQNGVDPSQFDLNVLNDNTEELNNLLNQLRGVSRTYTKQEISGLSKEEFLGASEIVINLDKPAFVSPKVKMSLSKKLIDTKTGQESSSKKLSSTEKQDLIIKHLTYTSKAVTAEEVKKFVMETGDEVFIKEFLENSTFRSQVEKASLENKQVASIYTDSSLENLLQDVIDTDSVDVPLDIQESFREELEDLKANPVNSKLRALANKIKRAAENRYKLVKASMDTDSLYHIPTTETEQEMFEQGYVRVVGDFYKKIDKSYDVQQLLEGLYNRYKEGTLPSHFNLPNAVSPELISVEELVRPNGNIGTQGFTPENMVNIIKFISEQKGIELPAFDQSSGKSELRQLIEFLRNDDNAKNLVLEYVKENPAEINKLPDDSYEVKDGNHRSNLLNLIGVDVIPALSSENINSTTTLSLEDFIDQMPNTLLDIYKMYYNTQIITPVNKKAAIVGNEQYLREDFKGDFAEFIQQEKNKGSELYREVLQHFQIADKGILKDDLLTRDKIDQYQAELGDNYGLLLNYSIINKHIDLQEQPESIIFVADIETINRLQAVNNPNLVEPSAKATIITEDTISFTKVNKSFIRHDGGVYEQVHTDRQGEYVYQRIATIDPNFLITEVAPPFSTTTLEESKEIDGTKTNINKTEGNEIDC